MKGVLVGAFLFAFSLPAFAAEPVKDVQPSETPLSLNSQEEQALEDVLTAQSVQIKERTLKEALADALSESESFACSEMSSFLHDVVLKDAAVLQAAEKRSAAEVSKTAGKYALAAAKDLNADYLFYMPNPRFFVRLNDKNYRGRMRLPKEFRTSHSACFWENLPSGDVVYSTLLRIDDDFPGYYKISKTLPNMMSNLPDVMSSYGKIRFYTTLNKDNFRKRNWIKMRRSEPNKPEEFSYCSKETFAFLSTIGNGPAVPKKQIQNVLSAIEKEQPFEIPERNAVGDAVMIKTFDDIQLGAVAYLVEKP